MKVILIIISTLIGDEYLYISNDYAYSYNTLHENGVETKKVSNQKLFDLNKELVYQISDDLNSKSIQEKIIENGILKQEYLNEIVETKYEKHLEYDVKLEYSRKSNDKGKILLLNTKAAIPLIDKYIDNDDKIKQLPGVGPFAEKPYWFTIGIELFGYHNNTIYSEMKFSSLKSIQEIEVSNDFFYRFQMIDLN